MQRRWTQRRPSRFRRARGDRLRFASRCEILAAFLSPAELGEGKASQTEVVRPEVHRVAVTSPAIAQEPRLATTVARRRRFSWERFLSPLLLAPSAVVIFIFVYGFIGYTFFVSLTNWKSAKPDMTVHRPIGAIYPDLFSQTRFQIDLRNTVVFTVAFLIMAVLGGLGLAILLDRHIRGSGFFRSVFLFPYALSFITTGVAWRWIFNPETGINLLIDATGINEVLAAYGAGPLKPGWITDPSVVWQLTGQLAAVFPAAGDWRLKMGFPVAMEAVSQAPAPTRGAMSLPTGRTTGSGATRR